MKLNMEDFDKKGTYQIMEKLCKEYSPRVSGSREEQNAIKFLSKCFKKNVGSLPMIENFQIKNYEGKYASLQLFPNNVILEGKPVWMTTSTPSIGVEAEVSYLRISELEEISSSAIENKIVVLQIEDDYLNIESFKKIKTIFHQKPIGAVILHNYQDGVIRSDLVFTDNAIFAKVPTMVLSEVEFNEYKSKEQLTGKLLIHGEINHEAISSNVSAIIQGMKNDFILVCTHHDTVENTQGCRDSAAAVALNLELARLISKQLPNYTYRFITFGGEKTGLVGVSELLKEYDPSRVLLSINLSKIESIPGKIQSFVVGDNNLFEMIKKIDESNSYVVESLQKTPNEGNNMVFAKNNIPSISLTFKSEKDSLLYHTELDTIETFSSESLEKMAEYAITVINRIEQMEDVEFSNNIPNNLHKETEDFFDKLEKYQK